MTIDMISLSKCVEFAKNYLIVGKRKNPNFHDFLLFSSGPWCEIFSD